MWQRMTVLAARAVACLLIALPAAAQRATGRILNAASGAPVPAASVILLDASSRERARVTSDDSGHYSIQLQPEAVTLRVMRIGFLPAEVRLAASSRDTVIDFRLEVTATQLDTARTTATATSTDPNIAEAARRQRTAAGGKFISDAQLAEAKNVPFSSLLRSHIPGLIFEQYRGQMLLRTRRGIGHNSEVKADPNDPRSPRGCWANVYFDGLAIYTGPPAVPPNFGNFNTRDFAAVEFYHGGASLPLQFRNMTNECGTLLLWVRRRPGGER